MKWNKIKLAWVVRKLEADKQISPHAAAQFSTTNSVFGFLTCFFCWFFLCFFFCVFFPGRGRWGLLRCYTTDEPVASTLCFLFCFFPVKASAGENPTWWLLKTPRRVKTAEGRKRVALSCGSLSSLRLCSALEKKKSEKKKVAPIESSRWRDGDKLFHCFLPRGVCARLCLFISFASCLVVGWILGTADELMCHSLHRLETFAFRTCKRIKNTQKRPTTNNALADLLKKENKKSLFVSKCCRSTS